MHTVIPLSPSWTLYLINDASDSTCRPQASCDSAYVASARPSHLLHPSKSPSLASMTCRASSASSEHPAFAAVPFSVWAHVYVVLVSSSCLR